MKLFLCICNKIPIITMHGIKNYNMKIRLVKVSTIKNTKDKHVQQKNKEEVKPCYLILIMHQQDALQQVFRFSDVLHLVGIDIKNINGIVSVIGTIPPINIKRGCNNVFIGNKKFEKKIWIF